MVVASPPADAVRKVRMSRNQIGRLAITRESKKGRRRRPVTFGLQLKGHPNAELIERALTEVAHRHAALRTYFPSASASGWAQCVDKEHVAWTVEVLDLCETPENERAAARERANRSLLKPFDPEQFPLFRGHLIGEADDWELAISVDHAIFDGASVQVFLEDLADAYRRLIVDPADTHAAQVSDQSEFGEYEREWLAGPEAAAAFDYWKNIWTDFGPFPATRLPVQSGQKGVGAEWKAFFPAQQVHDRQRSFTHGYMSLPALAASAVVTALRDVTGQHESGLLYPSSRRYFDGSERMIGYLNNRVLLRVETPAADDFPKIADRTRTAMLESLEHDMMPFEVLLERLAPHVPDRSPKGPYVHLNVATTQPAPTFPGLQVRSFWPQETTAFKDLPWISVDLDVDGECMVLQAGYSTSKLAPETVADLMSRVLAYLTGARNS
ncbi:hypothetical protein F6Q10_04575 [Streptomyces vinaceus]|nr:hypothetical protein [Streptomyces vinaceus]